MKYISDKKNTTPDYARRDLIEHGVFKVSREYVGGAEKNTYEVSEKFFLYYCLHKIEDERNVSLALDSSNQAQKLLCAEKTVREKIYKINEVQKKEPLEKLLGILRSLKRKQKNLFCDVSHRALSGETISSKVVSLSQNLDKEINLINQKIEARKKDSIPYLDSPSYPEEKIGLENFSMCGVEKEKPLTQGMLEA